MWRKHPSPPKLHSIMGDGKELMASPRGGICFLTATELARRIRAGRFSASEVMEAHLAQIERVNPQVNAIVTLLPEQAHRTGARAPTRRWRAAKQVGPLHGLPVAHKDLVPTKGIRTTFGSPHLSRTLCPIRTR